jgi:hypothetical protein
MLRGALIVVFAMGMAAPALAGPPFLTDDPVPTDYKGNGIGNGRTWYRLPLWILKSSGRWTTYGGGGYAVNAAPGATNYSFGGWLVERDFSESVTIGAELYSQGAQFVGDKWSTFYNAGSYISLTKQFGILFSIGHTFSGDNQSVAYFALGWNGALHRNAPPLDSFAPRPAPIGSSLQR